MDRRTLLGLAAIAGGALALWWLTRDKGPSAPIARRAAPVVPAAPQMSATASLLAAGISAAAGGIQNMFSTSKPDLSATPDSNGFNHQVYKGWTVRSAEGFVGTDPAIKITAYNPTTDGYAEEKVVGGSGPASPAQFADALRRIKIRIDLDPKKAA